MKRLLALAAALMLMASAAQAQRTDITIGMQLEPPNLDPTAGAAAAIDEVVYANVFEGLTRFADDGTVKPALAESWEIAPDGLSWVFHLHPGVTFHDGTPMTAEDVVFSFDRAMAPDSTNAQKQLFNGINEVTAIDDVTVEIGLDQPKGSLLTNLAWGDAVIVSPASADTNATIELLREISRSGITMVVIEHDMHVVFSLADRITVMAQGAPIVEDRPEMIKGNPKVQEAYLGGAHL